MNITFEQLLVLIGLLTTNIVIIITALKSKGVQEALQKDSEVKHEENKQSLQVIEKNTNSTLTLLQNKVDLLLDALNKSEMLRQQLERSSPLLSQPVNLPPTSHGEAERK